MRELNSNYKHFFTLTLEKFIFCRKHIWKKLIYIVTFVLQFFSVAGYWKCSNKTPTPI